jgi:hypothetical protein
MQAYEGVEILIHAFLSSTLMGGQWPLAQDRTGFI